ncbi:lipase [Vibrio cholerae]|uniref:VolA/Pla-1 family phospholipase n=1 Tax=Vibrio cholerae TaxID=666 RepID=UPI0004E41592|nr:VolA/Pla-1 family phospholipase [Vibrio cholerae]EJL6343250.1 lipase [Vibrio cholerae]EKF9471841.1 lipase [Vibrio cholerae]EKF9725091.1 lipase [Vibrio cholerae]KFE25509.1 extracellular lipase, Pla-1/cef family protein [Vibrio cholerae]TXY41436.1 lipase [Vibrio cholerae]
MKQVIKLSLLCSALWLAGCGDETNSSGASTEVVYESYIQQALQRDTTIKFSLSGKDANVPLPSFALMNAKDGTLEIPSGSNTSGSNPLVAMGQVDGWPITMPLFLDFKGAGLADNIITSGIYLYELTDSMTGSPSIKTKLTNGPDYTAISSASSGKILIVPKKALNASSEYILAVTSEVSDANGNPVGTSASYAALKSKNKIYSEGDIATLQKVTQGVEKIFQLNDVDETQIVYSTWFSTQSVSNTLFATRGATASAFASGSNQLETVWKQTGLGLDTAYTIQLDTPVDFVAALTADDNFSTYIGEDKKSAVITAFNTVPTVSVNVTKGTVRLPYYLETGSNWNTQPFESAMPSLAKIKAALADSKEQLTIGSQLLAAGIDTSKLATDASEQLKLMGLTLTKSDGSPLDPERYITRYSPVPKVKSVQDVPFLLFTPAGAAPTDIVIYQHGVTTAKENAYAFAKNLTAAGLAVIAIDLPLHGERSLDSTRSANSDPLAYINLTYLAVARDNLRQSILDVLGLRAALTLSQPLFTGTPLSNINVRNGSTKVRMLGHSLGGIVGTSAVAESNKTLGSTPANALYSFSGAAIQNSGGQISNLLLGSEYFGPQIKHNVALSASTEYKGFADAQCASLDDSACYNLFTSLATQEQLAQVTSGFQMFSYAAQTLLDTIDPYSVVSTTLNNGGLTTPLYFSEVDGDSVVPNKVSNPTGSLVYLSPQFAGTEPLASLLGLTTVNAGQTAPNATKSFVQFNSTAKHSTFVAPQDAGYADLAHHTEMQTETADFLLDDSLGAVSNSNSVLK